MYKSKILILFIAGTLFLSLLITPIQGEKFKNKIGFNKGPSYLNVKPLKKVTFVDYDEYDTFDDYAYLLNIPTSVYNYKNTLYSHPLIFYKDTYKYNDDKERSLNPRQGIDYFMEDWMGYCNNKLDQMTLINVPKNKIPNEWDSKEIIDITDDNIFNLANKIALQQWSYKDELVISVIDEKSNNPNIHTKGYINETLDCYNLGSKSMIIELPDIGASGGVPKFFDIEDKNYKYLTAKLSWFQKTLDYDLQLTDTKLGMLDIAMKDYAEHNSFGAQEIAGSYIHNYGKWKASVTAVPKKQIPNFSSTKINNKNLDLDLKEKIDMMIKTSKNNGQLDLVFYPGKNIDLPKTPFGCRDIDLTLKWNNPNVRLGFTVLGPKGSEIVSSISKEDFITNEKSYEKNEDELHITLLGETNENKNYSICVYSLDDITQPVDFEIEYNWKQNFTKEEADSFTSAANGAVLASKLNCPLLYISKDKISESTKNTIYKLGVKKIFIVNIGKHLNNKVKTDISVITSNIKEYSDTKLLYQDIANYNDKNEIVFTTIDPWTHWYVKELKPGGENRGERFIGPASYIAAHHSSPVVLIEQHPKLSQAITYHTDFWNSPYYKQHITEANSGNMMLSSSLVYEFLEEYELGRLERKSPEQQIRENIIIVAGQYDIGMSFDRSLTGAAIQGRFMFSPVDTSYCIARNIFYPALIFQNPALHGKNDYINGSKSEVQGLGSWKVSDNKNIFQSIMEIGARFKKPKGVNLVEIKPSQDEQFEYPVLMTFNTYAFRFNQLASKHWGTYYERADGVIPGITNSPDTIDYGAVPGKSGKYYPDISESENVPFYAKKAGYDSVFSTAFEPVIENLNRGVIVWVENCHGWQPDGGQITMWNPDSPYAYEENPWRSYEPITLYPGNFRNFIHLVGEQLGIGLPTVTDFHLKTKVGSTENPDVAHINTQLRLINKLLSKVKSPMDLWGAFGRMIYRDRILNPLKSIKDGKPLINWFDGDGKITISKKSGSIMEKPYYGYDFDDNLDNLHGCGLNTISCLPAGTYLHLTWLRHGMTWQIIDPWTTTDWAGAWAQMLLKWFAMGDTVGEAYERGMRACGPEYSVGHYWWDIWENVCYFGDPELRPYVPSTEFSDENYWTYDEVRPMEYKEDTIMDGHMPFGATSYPHKTEPKPLIPIWLIILFLIIILLIIVIIGMKPKIK